MRNEEARECPDIVDGNAEKNEGSSGDPYPTELQYYNYYMTEPMRCEGAPNRAPALHPSLAVVFNYSYYKYSRNCELAYTQGSEIQQLHRS